MSPLPIIHSSLTSKPKFHERILFGRCAYGEDTYNSNIDLFVDTEDHTAVLGIMSGQGEVLSERDSPIFMTQEEKFPPRLPGQPLHGWIRRGKVEIGEK